MPTQYLAAGVTYDKVFQQQLLVHLVYCPELLRDASQVLQPGDFELPIMRVACEALLGYYHACKSLPSCEVLEDCILRVVQNIEQKYTSAITPEEWPALAALVANLRNPGPLSEPYYREQLAAYIKWVRSFKVVAAENANIRRGGNATLLTQQLTEIGKQVDSALEAGNTQRSYLEETGIIETEEDYIPRVSTGLYDWDQYLSGGLALGGLGMITACPGVGKSNTLINLATAANSTGWQALLISLELRSRQIKGRWTAMSGCIKGETIKQILTDWLPEERRRYELLKQFELEHNSQFITSQDGTGKYITPASVEAGIENWKATIKRKTGTDEFCRFVGVDWLDWMQLLGRRDDMREDERTTELAKQLKFVAERQQVALWTATQGTREADGRAIVHMRDTAQGYHKNDPIDIGCGLGVHPESQQADEERLRVGDQRQAKQDYRRLVLTINKNRHGPTGMFDFYMAPTLRFYANSDAYERHNKMMAQPGTAELLWTANKQTATERR